MASHEHARCGCGTVFKLPHAKSRQKRCEECCKRASSTIADSSKFEQLVREADTNWQLKLIAAIDAQMEEAVPWLPQDPAEQAAERPSHASATGVSWDPIDDLQKLVDAEEDALKAWCKAPALSDAMEAAGPSPRRRRT